MKKKTQLDHVMDLKRLIAERLQYVRRQLKAKSEVKSCGQHIKSVNDEIEEVLERIR